MRPIDDDPHELLRRHAARSADERSACAAFLEPLADTDAYAAANLPAPELLRRVAAHLREREKYLDAGCGATMDIES